MSCNCIGNVYINENGESTPLTEYMCFDIIANNPFCCDNFNDSCLDRIYFDSSANTYVGCHGCSSVDSKCAQKIQIEANKLNPDKNSKCCENFDSYCTEAYETLKNSSGNFCSSSEDLLNFYTTTYRKSDTVIPHEVVWGHSGTAYVLISGNYFWGNYTLTYIVNGALNRYEYVKDSIY